MSKWATGADRRVRGMGRGSLTTQSYCVGSHAGTGGFVDAIVMVALTQAETRQRDLSATASRSRGVHPALTCGESKQHEDEFRSTLPAASCERHVQPDMGTTTCRHQSSSPPGLTPVTPAPLSSTYQ